MPNTMLNIRRRFREGSTYENLREANKNIRARNNPYIDVRGACGIRRIQAGGWLIVVTRGPLVKELLEDSRVQHGKACDKESCIDALDRREVNPKSAQGGIDKVVENRNEDLRITYRQTDGTI